MAIREKHHRLPKEYYQGDTVVALTLCVQNRNQIFTTPDIVYAFIGMLEEIIPKHQCFIPVYCFMPDHLHLIVAGLAENTNLLSFIQSFKQKTGYWMSKNLVYVRWQKNYYDHVLRRSESLLGYVRYILDNPVRKGLVAAWQEYPFIGSIGCNFNDVLQGMM
jgi:putative transposase